MGAERTSGAASRRQSGDGREEPEPSAAGSSRTGGNGSAPELERDLEEVRRVLLRGERERLERVERRLDRGGLDARALAAHLPQALALRAEDPELGGALAPIVEDAIQVSVRRNPQPLVDAIFPIIGPAIRRAIQSALAGMTEGFNAALENSLSVRGIRWRLEAWRTGRPFSEVVLLKSLVYRVEQVLWIDNESGLLLADVSAPGVANPDADVVSSMLTALQDYVGDSFVGGGAPRETIGEIEFGEHQLVAVPGPSSTLAALVRGRAPQEWRNELLALLERLHLEAAEELASFDGDSSPFRAWTAALENVLIEQRRERSKGWIAQALLAVVALAVILLSVRWFVRQLGDRNRLDPEIDLLDAELSERVLGGKRAGSGLRVEALRDPDARPTSAILGDDFLAEGRIEVREEAFLSLEPVVVLARARRELAPPDTVSIGLTGGVLRLEGSAAHRWIGTALRRAGSIGGVSSVDRTGLVDSGVLASSSVLGSERAAAPTFAEGAAQATRTLEDWVQSVVRIERQAASAAVPLRLDVAASPRPGETEELAWARAELLTRALRTGGVGAHATLRPLVLRDPSFEGSARALVVVDDATFDGTPRAP